MLEKKTFTNKLDETTATEESIFSGPDRSSDPTRSLKKRDRAGVKERFFVGHLACAT
jgi:hypothetical protein